MTDQTLRDLLEERVADLEPRDLAPAAWSAGRRSRRRRTTVLVAAAAVVVAAVSGAPALVASRSPDRAPTGPPGAPSPSATSATSAGKTDTHRGVPVTWAPLAEDEGGLPVHTGTALPATIDLSPGLPSVPPGSRAVALFQLWDDDGAGRVVVVDDTGGSYGLDARRLEPVGDRHGNLYLPAGERSLAPDGAHAFFRQRSSLEVYSFDDGSWTTIRLPDWASESARWLDADEIWVPDRVGVESGAGTAYRLDGGSARLELPAQPVWDAGEEPFGPTWSLGGPQAVGAPVARAYFLTEGSGAGRSYAGLDGVLARTASGSELLVFPAGGPSDDGRWKACCPVLGWVDSRTVLVLSRGDESRILAWDVAAGAVSRVSELTGWVPGAESYVASLADPPRRP